MGAWGGGVAAACLTVLSLWRWQDGETGWATALLCLAFVQLAVTARRTSSLRGPGAGAASGAASDGPSDDEVAHARRHLPGWRVIGVAAMLGAVAAVAVLPPLALVLAGLGVYAMLRARGYGRLVAAGA